MFAKRSQGLLVAVVVLLLVAVWYSRNEPSVTSKAAPQITIGWQTAWAQQGQVMQVLEKSNIQELLGLNINLIGFLFGPDLNEAANSGSIKITNAGIVPAINLLAANPHWIIVGRQVDFDISIVARSGSNVRSVADLAGKRFGVPIGGGSHPFAIAAIRSAGLSEGVGLEKVEVINVKPSEMPIALEQGQVDAIASWDPTTTLALDRGGEIVATIRYTGFILADKRFASENNELMVKLLQAYGLAFFFSAQNKEVADRLFSDAAKINYALVARLPTTEPNLSADDLHDIKLVPSAESLALAQSVADEMLSLGLVKAKVVLVDRLDDSFARAAERALMDEADAPTKIRVPIDI